MIGTLTITLLLMGGPTHKGVGIAWEHDFGKAMRKARAAGQPLLVDFWADWCSYCHLLDRTTYVDPTVIELTEGFVAVKVDTEAHPKGTALAARYGIDSLPTIAFLSPSGVVILRSGFQGPGQFPRTLKRAKIKAAKVMGWEAILKHKPGDTVASMKLGVHLYDQESYDESCRLLARARKTDKRQPIPDRKQIRLLLGAMLYRDREYARSEEVLKEALRLGSEEEYDAKILYVLGRTYLRWGRKYEARKVLKKLIERYPDSAMAEQAWDSLGALESRKHQ
jgi:thiol-disulfide isomerase/thioredoxin